MKARTLKNSLGKKKPQNGSGALLDSFDRIDLQDEDKEFNDSQYDSLIRDSANYRKTIGAHDFEEDPKYQGVKISKDLLFDIVDDEEGGDDDEEILSEEADFNDEEDIEEEAPQKKKKAKANINGLDIDEMLNDIDAQDQELVSSKKDKAKELKKATAVKQQQGLFDMLVESRVKMQDMLKSANSLPYPETYPYINKVDNTGELKKCIKELEVEVVDFLDVMDEISNAYHAKSEKACKVPKKKRVAKSQAYLKANNIKIKEFVKSYDFDTEQIWKSIDDSFNTQYPYIDGVVSNWAQKFNMLSQSSIKGRFANIFQTPTQQAQKSMDDYDRLLKKSQLRDLSANPLFEVKESSSHDEEIYNDEEFYMMIFREMLQKQAQMDAQNDHGDFLIENTRAYLKNKQLKSKNKKEVDRRASKNRKIRYDVHPKLVNFMAPIENITLIPGRDQMLKNLFGLYEKAGDKAPDQVQMNGASSGIKKKRRKNPGEDEVEINLL